MTRMSRILPTPLPLFAGAPRAISVDKPNALFGLLPNARPWDVVRF